MTIIIIFSYIRKVQNNGKCYRRFSSTDLIDDSAHLPSVYKEAKKAFNQLTDLKWLIEDLENIRFAFRHLLNTSDAKCGYNDGNITVVLNPLLKDYFIEMAHYTTYDLKWSMTFSSWYSMRLFEILSAFRDTGVWWVSISEYRKLMDCENKYPEQKDLIKKTTEKALLELEPTNMAFAFKPVLDENHLGRGRKPIIALEFRLKKVQLKKIPNIEIPANTQIVIDRLMKRYQVSEINIVKYLKAITTEETRKLLNSWDIKEASADPIKNKLFYCNKVFVAMGKKALGEKE